MSLFSIYYKDWSNQDLEKRIDQIQEKTTELIQEREKLKLILQERYNKDYVRSYSQLNNKSSHN